MGFEVEILRRTRKGMTVFSLDGREIYANDGSYLYRVLERLPEIKRRYFTTKDVTKEGENTKRVSHVLTRLYRKGAIARSKGPIIIENETFYLYFSIKDRDLHDFIVEEFLEQHLPKEIVEIYKEIKYSKEVWSNYDIKQIYGTANLALLDNYVRNGLLCKKHVKRYKGEYVYATFYWAPEIEVDIEKVIEEKLSKIKKERQRKINLGKKFEETVYQFFDIVIKNFSLVFRIYEYNKQVKKDIRGKIRIFDLVAYAAPYVKVNGEWQKLKWFHGSLVIVFEVKYNETIGAGWLAKFTKEVEWAYGKQAIPAVIVAGEAGRVTDSAWEFARMHRGIWIITASEVRKIYETLRGSIFNAHLIIREVVGERGAGSSS